MSFKSKVLAAAATLTLVGGASAAGTLSASAATGSCGFGIAEHCINIFNKQFGRDFLLDVFRQGSKVGQPIILFRASNTDPAEDFTASGLLNADGTAMTVSELNTIDPIFNAATLVHFSDKKVWEFQYAPNGVDSGLCVGVRSTAYQNEPVTLQPCGFTAKTVWIQDDNLNNRDPLSGATPFINGSNTNFSQPFVLNYPRNGYPTDVPRPQLTVRQLQTYSNTFPGTNVFQNQQWRFFIGPVF